MSPDLLIFVGLVFCYFYILMAEFFTHRKCNYIHETAVAILLGGIFGLVIFLVNPQFLANPHYEASFRDVTILLLLPPMLFEDGYNIRKRKFFQNIFYINLYGLLGTILNFVAIFGIVYVFNANNLLTAITGFPLQIKTWQIIIFSSVMCSIDTVVPQKIVNPQRYPKLFSIIFGQSIFKDTIAVTLFDAIISTYQHNGSQDVIWNARNIGLLIAIFLKVFFCSILIGIIAGMLTTLIFKHMRFLLAEKGVAEVALILLTGYSAYILSEWASCSGVISMLFCGITLSHFNIYNLSDEGKVSSKITVSMLALIAESFLFFSLGIMMFDVQFNQDEQSNIFLSFSWNFLLVGLFAVIVARFVNVYLISLIGYLIIGKKNWRLNRYEYEILFISGLVKGAVPFALILSMPESNTLASNSVQNTTILIVFCTSLIFNSIMPKILRNRQYKIRELLLQNAHHPSLFDSLLIPYGIDNNIISPFSENNRVSEQSKKKQFFFLQKVKSKTQKYWRRCEEGFLKPLLIFNYYARKEQIKQEKLEKRRKQAEQYWRRYNSDSFLGSEDEEQNKFLDIELIEKDFNQDDQDDDEEEESQQAKSQGFLKIPGLNNKQRRTQSNAEPSFPKIRINFIDTPSKSHSKSQVYQLNSFQKSRRPPSIAEPVNLNDESHREIFMEAIRDDLLSKRQRRRSQSSIKIGNDNQDNN